MYRPINAIPSVFDSLNRSLWRRGFLLIALALAFALSPPARALTPAPDGGYAGGNTAEGTQALFGRTSGLYLTGVGQQALFSDTSGSYNTGEGFRTLFSNTTGFFNTAVGVNALYHNTTANYNSAFGFNALFNNTTGTANEASGSTTLYRNTTGVHNAANGFNALYNNTTGSFNIALGSAAGFNLTTGSNNIDIGNTGVAAETGIIRIGTSGTHTATFLQGLVSAPGGVTVSGGGDVRLNGGDFKPLGTSSDGVQWVDAGGTIQAHIHRFGAVDNRLYITNAGSANLTGVYLAQNATSLTSTSDERLKSDVEPVTGILEKIKNIRVVDFNMAQLSADPVTKKMMVDRNPPPRKTRSGTVIKDQIGTIAQDWMKDFPEMVVEPQKDDEYYGLNYDRIGIVALGAVKELNNIVSKKDAEIAQLAGKLAALEARDKAREERLTRLENAAGNRSPRAIRERLDAK